MLDCEFKPKPAIIKYFAFVIVAFGEIFIGAYKISAKAVKYLSVNPNFRIFVLFLPFIKNL